MPTRRTIAAASLVFVLVLTAAAAATTYKIDPDHSSVAFQIRHLFTSVSGRFEKFEGVIRLDEKDPAKTSVEGSIDAASIDTNVARRDNHLRSPDFFDVEKFPKISFRTTSVSDVDTAAKTAKLHGLLTMHGVERPVVLEVAFLGSGKDPAGNTRAGFQASTTINRKDFGLDWNKALEAGGFLVGDEVKITIDAETVAAP
ncbi:MAG: YceI family protein [Candidatus Binatia bacterium]